MPSYSRTLERPWRAGLEAPRRDLCPQPLGPLGPEDVDATVQDAPATGDRILGGFELREQRGELGIGERQQVRERFHGCLSGREGSMLEDAA